MTKDRQFHQICEDDESYYVFGIIGQRILKNSDPGKVWKYLSEHEGVPLSLEEIAKISGRENAGGLIGERFFKGISKFTEYTIERTKGEKGQPYYALKRKPVKNH